MEIRRNEHAICRVEGTIPEAESGEAILQPLAGTQVMAGSGDRLLFAGMLREVQAAHEGGHYHMSLNGATFTLGGGTGKEVHGQMGITKYLGHPIKLSDL